MEAQNEQIVFVVRQITRVVEEVCATGLRFMGFSSLLYDITESVSKAQECRSTDIRYGVLCEPTCRAPVSGLG